MSSGDKVSRASAENDLGDTLVAAGGMISEMLWSLPFVRCFSLAAAGHFAERGFGFPSQCLASARCCLSSPFLVTKDKVAKTSRILVTSLMRSFVRHPGRFSASLGIGGPFLKKLSTPLFFKSGFWTYLGLLAGSSRGCSSQKVDC